MRTGCHLRCIRLNFKGWREVSIEIKVQGCSGSLEVPFSIHLNSMETPLSKLNAPKPTSRCNHPLSCFCSHCLPGSKMAPSQKCTVGMSSAFPIGFVWKDQWHPVFCRTSSMGTADEINTCLGKKRVYFMGDSTVRQWLEHLENTVDSRFPAKLAEHPPPFAQTQTRCCRLLLLQILPRNSSCQQADAVSHKYWFSILHFYLLHLFPTVFLQGA